MIYVGIDDTDTLDSPGTNQLARALKARLAGRWRCRQITRHQLLFDPRVPYTSKNGSASLLFEPESASSPPLEAMIAELRAGMRERFVSGSDPGLCVARSVPPEITAWGRHCQQEVVDQKDARRLAAEHGIHLEGLGGTEGGVIGALAAVGLIVTGCDGRVVQFGEYPDDLTGPVTVDALRQRGVEVRDGTTQSRITAGLVDVGKHLRPNCRDGRIVLLVGKPQDRSDVDWLAMKCV